MVDTLKGRAMFITNKVRICLAAFEVMKRADCEYVPTSVFERVHDGEISKDAFKDVLHYLVINGILETRLGFYGGFKHARPVSLLELMQIFSPTRVPEPDEELYRKPINETLEKLNTILSECVIVPEKSVPLDYCLDDDDVETASMDAHGPTDGHLCK